MEREIVAEVPLQMMAKVTDAEPPRRAAANRARRWPGVDRRSGANP